MWPARMALRVNHPANETQMTTVSSEASAPNSPPLSSTGPWVLERRQHEDQLQ